MYGLRIAVSCIKSQAHEILCFGGIEVHKIREDICDSFGELKVIKATQHLKINMMTFFFFLLFGALAVLLVVCLIRLYLAIYSERERRQCSSPPKLKQVPWEIDII